MKLLFPVENINPIFYVFILYPIVIDRKEEKRKEKSNIAFKISEPLRLYDRKKKD